MKKSTPLTTLKPREGPLTSQHSYKPALFAALDVAVCCRCPTCAALLQQQRLMVFFILRRVDATGGDPLTRTQPAAKRGQKLPPAVAAPPD